MGSRRKIWPALLSGALAMGMGFNPAQAEAYEVSKGAFTQQGTVGGASSASVTATPDGAIAADGSATSPMPYLAGEPARVSTYIHHTKRFVIPAGSYRASVTLVGINGSIDVAGLTQGVAQLNVTMYCEPEPCGYRTGSGQDAFLSSLTGPLSASDATASANWVFTMPVAGTVDVTALTEMYLAAGLSIVPAGYGSIAARFTAQIGSIQVEPHVGG